MDGKGLRYERYGQPRSGLGSDSRVLGVRGRTESLGR